MPLGGRLTITTMCQPSAWAEKEGAARWPTGEEICISVRDTGTGIPEENLEQIFDPYFSTKEAGIGLGLAVTYGIIQEHAGTIEVIGSGAEVAASNDPAGFDLIVNCTSQGLKSDDALPFDPARADAALAALDAYEAAEYDRLMLHTSGGEEVWTYVWTAPLEGMREIPGGRWR